MAKWKTRMIPYRRKMTISADSTIKLRSAYARATTRVVVKMPVGEHTQGRTKVITALDLPRVVRVARSRSLVNVVRNSVDVVTGGGKTV